MVIRIDTCELYRAVYQKEVKSIAMGCLLRLHCDRHCMVIDNLKTDPEHFQPLSSQCDMHVKLPHQATFVHPEACFLASMGSKSPKKYKEWMKALLWPHLTKIENDQKIRKTFLKNLIAVNFLLWAPGQSYHPSHVFALPKQV